MNATQRPGTGRPALLAGLGLLAALSLATSAVGAGPDDPAPTAEPSEATPQSSIEELEEKIRILAEEIADLKSEEAVPETVEEDWTFSGLGPGASKVYRRDRGLSLGGYGDVRFRHFANNEDGKASIYDALRLVLYTGYKFNDWIVFNSEVEFEHADTGNNGSVAVEFLTLDFLFEDWVNARTGLLLIPMGFVNEVHEPPFYFGAERPEVERRILPTTWRENGVGIFGTLGMGGAGDLEYRFYGVNGFDATGFSSSGLRGGRQNGSEALADQFAFVGRVDYDVSALAPGLLFGASVYAGKSGQNQEITRCIEFCDTEPGEPEIGDVTASFSIPDSFIHIYEVHAQYKAYGLSLRGLFAQAFIDDAGRLSNSLGLSSTSSVAKEMLGGYAEIAYDVLPLVIEDTEMSLEPFFRYEYVDTQHEVANGFRKNQTRDFDLYVVGLSFEPIPQVVLKLDYRDFAAKRGSLSDEIQASVGFVF